MKRLIKGDALILLAVLCAAALFFALRPAQNAAVAYVSVGEQLCREIPLTREMAGRHTFTDGGITYTVEVEEGRVRMADIGCPDQICVKTGWVNGDMPIVCLPSRLIIEVKGGGGHA